MKAKLSTEFFANGMRSSHEFQDHMVTLNLSHISIHYWFIASIINSTLI